MSIPSPPLTESQTREKLLVVRFLNAHLAHGGIEQHGYDILYRMVMMISSLGKDLHAVSHTNIAHASIVRKMEWHVGCVIEGCEILRRHFKRRLGNAQSAAAQLPELESTSEEALKGKLRIWRDRLRRLHIPTGNDARLVRHLANHFDDSVYRAFLQLHRRDPEHAIWCLNEQLTGVQQALEDVHDLCLDADSIVRHLDEEFEHASSRLKRAVRGEMSSTVIQPALHTHPTEEVINFESSAILSTPRTEEGPPQLPPLPFQAIDPKPSRYQQHLIPDQESGRHPISNKSFSAVEDQVAHRGHFRNATVAETGYTADAPATVGLGIAQPYPRHPHQGLSASILRKGSVGNVPRVFTGSFHELESDIFNLMLHKVQTPEQQSSTSPAVPSSPTNGPVIRDFADASRTPSRCPSPVSLLQRREALVSRDAQWESREVNGEMVRSRRPSEKIQRSLTIDDRTHGLDAWLRQHAAAEPASPETPGSAVRRGMLRQRENTL
ncbi:hypothetical protein LTR85_006473 [Meristemomyces frigidus]|nr:hypothetical protein LTR85_006473 [Meristemomyces frigidus]